MSNFDILSSQASKEEEFDADDYIELERAKKELEDKVSSLTKENNVLLAQFTSAVKITDQLRQEKQNSENLSQQVRTLSSEKEDLQRRLDISNKSFQEISSKYEQLKDSYAKQRAFDEETQKSEIKRIKLQYQTQLDDLQENMENIKETSNGLEIEQKSLYAKTDRLVSLHYKIIIFFNH